MSGYSPVILSVDSHTLHSLFIEIAIEIGLNHRLCGPLGPEARFLSRFEFIDEITCDPIRNAQKHISAIREIPPELVVFFRAEILKNISTR